MNFLNSYTSIFNKKFTNKLFINLFFLLLLVVLLASFLLKLSDITLNGNDEIKKYQLSKINSNNFKNVNTIIIGDSSAGNAIDAKYFTSLSQTKTMNLALTGSWGIIGSLGILKKATKVNKNINNIIIVHTIDIWDRDFSKHSVIELFSIKDISNILSYKELLTNLFNPKEFVWHFDYLFNGYKAKLDINNDYILQKNKKYSNNLKRINPNSSYDSLKISSNKIKELYYLEKYCIENKLNCFFMHGPILKNISDNSSNYIKKIKDIKFKINSSNNIFSYKAECIGDSNDHIDISCKKKSTLDYYNNSKKILLK